MFGSRGPRGESALRTVEQAQGTKHAPKKRNKVTEANVMTFIIQKSVVKCPLVQYIIFIIIFTITGIKIQFVLNEFIF